MASGDMLGFLRQPNLRGLCEQPHQRVMVDAVEEGRQIKVDRDAVSAAEVFAHHCASADWMERNMFRRVEAAFPIEQKSLKKRVIHELDLYLKDNTQTWMLQSNGEYLRVRPGRKPPVCAQLLTSATTRPTLLPDVRFTLNRARCRSPQIRA